ncbi:opioid growth factor receptor isoform X2 [Oncorhynchus mykiss]|uniref:opioid growth factor receptor isoform X2 n=1 Tax=Oncorhynchus mykiss TaxID=8022 RepID=UPI00187812AB|nr:opioid growth factor receptor isoform X2 [Oncorhynchus mykiss]
MRRRIERLCPFFLVPVLSYLPWRSIVENYFARFLERTGRCILPNYPDCPESLSGEGVGSPESLSGEGVGSPESLLSEGVRSPESLPSEGVGSPESLFSEEVESPESLPSEGVGSPESLFSEEVESPESIPSEGVGSPESLPSEGVGSPESLFSEEVESPESLPSEGVGSPESLPSEGVGSPESLFSEEVESPESLPSEGVGSPESLPSGGVGSPESLFSEEVESPESLPSEGVGSPESLPSGGVGSPESLFSEEVESPESLFSEKIEIPESFPSEGVGSPESLFSEEVESPESLPSRAVERPETLLSGEVKLRVLRSTRSYDVEDTDEYYCEYDSTWEDPPNKETSGQKSQHWVHQYTSWSQQSHRFNRFKSAAKDMQKYRHDYPEHRSNLYFGWQQQEDMPNLKFYREQIPSSPDGVFIEDFHKKWNRQYLKLERVHSYIQWLFPLQEPGMNNQAKELTKKEIEAFLQDETAKKRLVKSYKLMLDFYGIQLSNDTTGEVRRANNWRDRFDNLDRHTHNNLRITRILKCLGTLGFPHYQAPLVRFFLEETLVKGNLYNVKESVLNYFIFAVIDKQQRRELVKYAYKHYEPKHEFVWCPKKIQMIFSNGEEFSDSRQTMAGHYQHGNYLDDRDVSDNLSIPRNAIVSTAESIQHPVPRLVSPKKYDLAPERASIRHYEDVPKYVATHSTGHSHTAQGNVKTRSLTKDVLNNQGNEKIESAPTKDSEGKNNSVKEPLNKEVSQSQLKIECSAIEQSTQDPSQSPDKTTEGPAIDPCPKDPYQSPDKTTEGPAIDPCPKDPSQSQVQTTEGPTIELSPHKVPQSKVNIARTRDAPKSCRAKKPRIGEITKTVSESTSKTPNENPPSTREKQ